VKYTLFMGILVFVTLLAGGCAGMGAAAEPPADYATQLAEWVEAHQADKEERNRWQEFVEVSTAVCAAWEYFTLTNERIAGIVGRDPNNNFGAADPGLIDAPEYAGLVPELRTFFAVLDKTKLLDRMDELAGPSRFVALRAVDPMLTASMPELGRARLCARICAARMRLAAMEGKPEQVVRSLRHALAMARAVCGRGLLVSAGVGDASWFAAEREVRLEVLDGRLNAGACAAALDVLTRTPPPEARTALGGERFFVLESIDVYFGQRKQEAAGGEGRRPSESQGAGGALASRDEQIVQANRYFRAADELFSPDEAVRRHGQREIEAVAALTSADAPPHYKPLGTLLPGVDAAARGDRKQRLYHDGTRIMLALEVFRGRTGRYPERLEELTPGELGSVPPDPFGRGGAFGYRRLEPSGTDPSGSYVLYSVGSDGEDNGGKRPPKNPGSVIGAGPAGRGYDYVVNTRER
jgi:hypothetical protein